MPDCKSCSLCPGINAGATCTEVFDLAVHPSARDSDVDEGMLIAYEDFVPDHGNGEEV